jgi:hypothetical protein
MDARRWRFPTSPTPDLSFPTPSRKVEFFSERATQLGLPSLPVYEPIAEDAKLQPERAARYPLLFRQGRTLTHFHAFYDQGRALPTLAKADPEPRLWINPADAAARGSLTEAPSGSSTIAARWTRGLRSPTGCRSASSDARRMDRHQHLTNGGRAVPDAAAKAFPGGQAAFEAARRGDLERSLGDTG